MPWTQSLPRLAWNLVGPPTAQPLVFVSGLGGVQAAWFNQVRAFQEHFYVLTFDHRGTGASDASDAPATVETFAADLGRLLDELGLGPVDAVGLSFGGRVLQALALQAPHRLRRMVLGGTSCGGQGRVIPDAVRALSEAPLTDLDAEQARWEDRILPVLFGRRYRERYPDRMRSLARWRARHPTDPVGLRAQWDAWRTFDVCGRLGEIATPTLVLHGEDDALATRAGAEQLARGLRSARLEILPGVGHSPNVEDPEAFNGAISRFLRAV